MYPQYRTMGKRLFYLGLNSKPGNTVMCFVFMIFKSRISSWKIGLQVRRCVQGQTGWSNYGPLFFWTHSFASLLDQPEFPNLGLWIF